MSNSDSNHHRDRDPTAEAHAATTPSSDGPAEQIAVEPVVDEGIRLPVQQSALVHAVRQALIHRGFTAGEIGVRVSDDPGIHEINRQYLGHDYATDVISFTYDCHLPIIHGELIVSLDTAQRRSQEIGWPVAHELLLYVIHGSLHLTGMEDTHPPDRAEMREAERQVLQRLGIEQSIRFAADTVVGETLDNTEVEVTSDPDEQ